MIDVNSNIYPDPPIPMIPRHSDADAPDPVLAAGDTIFTVATRSTLRFGVVKLSELEKHIIIYGGYVYIYIYNT